MTEEDKEILRKITEIIQPTKPLQFINSKAARRRKGFENSQNQYRLVIANKHISKRLVELGCGNTKTHTLTFPTEDQVPKHLQRHFIRGYFDGDGCVSRGKRAKIDIVGTISFLESIQTILENEIGFYKSKLNQRYRNRENTIRSLQIGGISQAIKFGKWLYEDSTIFMKRKKGVFDDYSSLKERR